MSLTYEPNSTDLVFLLRSLDVVSAVLEENGDPHAKVTAWEALVTGRMTFAAETEDDTNWIAYSIDGERICRAAAHDVMHELAEGSDVLRALDFTINEGTDDDE